MESLSVIREVLFNPWALILALFFFGASIFIHELGHYLAARWRGLKIERFSIGMGPRIFGWTDKHGVEWRLSAIPLGGYVMLPQMSDMKVVEGAPENDADALPPLSWTDKVTVALAGAVFNVIFAFAIATLLWQTGIPREAWQNSTVVGYVSEEITLDDGTAVPGPAYAAGLRPGDDIQAIDGRSVNDFDDIFASILMGDGRSEEGEPSVQIDYLRDGKLESTVAYPAIVGMEKIRLVGFQTVDPVMVADVFPNSPAELAGLKSGDELVAINGEPLYNRAGLITRVQEHPTEAFKVDVLRDGEKLQLDLKPMEVQISHEGETAPMVGIRFFTTYSTANHIPPHEQVLDIVNLTYRTLGALLSPSSNVGLRSLNGPVGILNALRITAEQGMLMLLYLVVLINVNLAVVNLLPLPILDGGHIVLATIQKLRGKPVPAKYVIALQNAMAVCLLGMVVYVTYFDVLRIGQSGGDAVEESSQEPFRISFPEPTEGS
jgi:regulator of sigma E protease